MVKTNNWQSDFLKQLSIKQYGRSYDDKYNNAVKAMGGNADDARGFRNFLDTMNLQKSKRVYKPKQGSTLEQWDKESDQEAAARKAKAEKERKQREAQQKKQQAEQRTQKPLLSLPKTTKENSLWNDIGKSAKAALQISTHLKTPQQASIDTAKSYLKEGETPNDITKELSRGITRTGNNFSLGLLKELTKNDSYYKNNVFNEREGKGKALDMLYEGLGYALPAGTAYKTLNASKVGKGLTEFGAKKVVENATKKEIAKQITKRLASEAVKGGAIGAGLSTVETAIKEAINPDDQNWKDNAKYIGTNTILGGIADPLFYGVGRGLSKGMETAANKTMKNLLPDEKGIDKAIQELTKYNKENKALPIKNVDGLIPKGNDITNPDFVAKLNPKEQIKAETPKVNGRTLDEILANPKTETTTSNQDVISIPKTPINKEIPKSQDDSVMDLTDYEHLVKDLPPKKQGERSFYSTVQNPDKLTPELKAKLDEFDKTYKPMSNQELVDYANEYVANDIEKAYQFVKNAKKFDSRHVTVGHRLIDELQKAGQYDRALDVVERLAEQGTKAGQSIQSYSIYNRLTAEGQLLRAQRHINKINQTITDPAKQVKLTEQNIQDITHTADSIQKMTGQMEEANKVIKIMDSLKKGNIATDEELEIVRSFVSDAKKFVGDLDPKAPAAKLKPVKDVRTRDKVVDFMSKKEEVSRNELKKILGRANSLPVDAFYHLSVIGASKVAKGTVKLTDFTEEMVKDFGEVVRPYAKQLYNKAVETFNLQSESMTSQRLSEVEKITNKALKEKKLSMDEMESIKEFARKVGQMSGDAKLEKSMELQSVLQALEVPTFGQKLSTAQTIAQLLNPKTIVRNAIGNELFYRVEEMNKFIATPIDILRSKMTGGERTITFVTNNQGEYWRNWLSGAKAGWKGVNPMGLQTQYDLGPQAFRSKWNPLTYLEKTLGATLRSFDHAGYMRAYNKTLGELASLRAINEGLTGQARKEAIQQYIREADENMLQIADQYGKYATFQDNTALATGLTKLKQTMNKYTTGTKEFGLGDMVLKYPKTPANLVMRAIEYSPAGVVRSASLLKTMAKTKDPAATREFWLSLTRAITGTTGFSVMGYFLANNGILTSSGNSDFEIANLEKMAGKQSNSVNISALKRFVMSGFNPKSASVKKGDTFISYDWAQPVSMAVALGTGVSQSQKENGKLGLVGSAKGAFDSATNTIIQSSVLKGLNDFLANYPGRKMSDRFGDAAKGMVGSFVPTIFNQSRQLNDNTARTTYDPSFLKETLNRALNRVPGLDSQLPPSYDTLGNKRQTYQNGSNNLFNVLLNPSFVSQYNPSPEAKFLLDYINETGDKTAAPRMADKKLDGMALTGKQFSDLQKIQGQEALKQLKEVLPSLKGNNDVEAVHKEIYKILNDAGKKGRSAIREKLVTQDQLNEAKKKYGLDKETVLHRINTQGWTVQKALTTPE